MPPIFGGEELPAHLLLYGHYPHYQQDRKYGQASGCCADQIEVCDHYGRGYVRDGV